MDRIIAGQLQVDDKAVETSLRPQSLAEYIGQTAAKQQLAIYIAAAKGRGEALDHVLLHGPPGLGKTTLAHIVAKEMGASLRITAGPALERAGDLAAILSGLGDRDVLFIDEIHRMSPSAEEILYPALEDGVLDVVLGKGPGARRLRLELPRFTLVGATTRMGLLTAPLRDRFGVQLRLDFYNREEMGQVLRRSARILGISLAEEAEEVLATRARGTPRVANRLLRRLRDVAQVQQMHVITEDVARQGLQLLGVDELGLDRIDRRYLETLYTAFGGGPAGLETLSAAIGEESGTVEDVVEPYLLLIGFIQRTPRGRMLTRGAYRHFGWVGKEES